MFRGIAQTESGLFNQIKTVFRWDMEPNADGNDLIQRQIALGSSHSFDHCSRHHGFLGKTFPRNTDSLHVCNECSTEAAGQVQQHLRHFLSLLERIFCAALERQSQAPAIILFIAVQLAEHITSMFIADIVTHKAETALIYMRIAPFRQTQLITLSNDILWFIEANVSIRMDVAARVNEFTECLVPYILIRHLLRADYEGLAAMAFAKFKGKGRNVIILYEVQRAFGGRKAHMNHAVSQLVIVDIEFFRQLPSRCLQLETHVPTQLLHITQLIRNTLSKQSFWHLQALTSDVRLPLYPFNRATLILF